MDYSDYKLVRDTAWKCLIDCGISELPVKLSIICRKYNVEISKTHRSPLIVHSDSSLMSGLRLLSKNDLSLLMIPNPDKLRDILSLTSLDICCSEIPMSLWLRDLQYHCLLLLVCYGAAISGLLRTSLLFATFRLRRQGFGKLE